MSRQRSPFNSPIVWLGGFIVVAFVIALALGGGGGEDTAEAGETGTVTITGDTLGEFAQPDPAIGLTAPTVTGQSFDGSAVELATGARVYGFFAHWCPHCQEELPLVTEWLDAGVLPDGVDFVAVSTAVEPEAGNYPPSAWFDDVGYDDTVFLDDQVDSTARAFGLTGFPYWVVTDADGAVVFRVGGQIDETQFAALGEFAASGSTSS